MPRYLLAEPADVVLGALAEALDQIDLGIALLDRDMRVRYLNRRLIEIFDLPSAPLADRPTYRDLLEYTVVKGWLDVPADGLTAYLDQREAAVRCGASPPMHIDLRDGRRLLFACGSCPDGSRILTYTDVSAELRQEALTAMEQLNAELRYNNETMEDHAANLASLAEATDESARKVQLAKLALEHEIVERRQLEAQLRRMATTDALTGALNRAGFLAISQGELERAQAAGEGLALMMLDIDHFKSINDRHGHAGGDVALRHLVSVISGRIRRTDRLGRLGGEEFAILVPGIAPATAERSAKRLVAFIAACPVTYGDDSIRMTVSVGLTVATPADRSIETVIARADDALYRAKETGRNRVVSDRATVVA